MTKLRGSPRKKKSATYFLLPPISLNKTNPAGDIKQNYAYNQKQRPRSSLSPPVTNGRLTFCHLPLNYTDVHHLRLKER